MTQAELAALITMLVPHIEARTTLPSRWNGRVVVTEEEDSLGQPAFAGKKAWDCSILLHRAFVGHSGVFERLVHELLHSVSAGVDPGAYRDNQGFEEGVVEQLTRLLGPEIAKAIGRSEPFEVRKSYNPELVNLENLRLVAGMAFEPFYLGLIRTPLRRREHTVIQWAVDAHPEIAPARILAQIASDLRGLK